MAAQLVCKLGSNSLVTAIATTKSQSIEWFSAVRMVNYQSWKGKPTNTMSGIVKQSTLIEKIQTRHGRRFTGDV